MKNYAILKAPGEKEMGSKSGRQWMEEGFEVILDREYDGGLFELRVID